MAKRNLITVKEAAEILGLDERSVRERLINGQLKGEKRNIGLREKWFVNASAVEAAAGKQKPFEPDALEEAAVDAETIDVGDEPDIQHQDWLEDERKRLKMLAEEMIQPLLHTIRQQERELQQKDSQIRLLPDLQKQAEERAKQLELEHVEKEALKKQISAMEEEKQQLEAKANEATALAADLQKLRAKVDELQKPWWKKIFQSDSDAN